MGADDAVVASHVHITLQVLLIVVTVALGLWALYELAAVVFVLILAALLAYVVEPLVRLAECETRITGRPRRLSRGTAVGLVYVVLAGSVSLGSLVLMPSVLNVPDGPHSEKLSCVPPHTR